MEVTKAQLLEVCGALHLPKEEIEGMDTQIFHVIAREQLERYLATMRNQNRELAENRRFIKSMLAMSADLSKDLSKPLTAATRIVQMISKPEKLVEKYGPVIEQIQKYQHKQITDGKENE